MKRLIVALSLMTQISVHAGQVKSECSAISENRIKTIKVNSENNLRLKKSTLAQ